MSVLPPIPETESEAEALGRSAWKTGLRRVPSSDVVLMGAMTGAVGEHTHLMRAWLRGWDAANLDDDREICPGCGTEIWHGVGTSWCPKCTIE
jgi:hypothetical protein